MDWPFEENIASRSPRSGFRTTTFSALRGKPFYPGIGTCNSRIEEFDVYRALCSWSSKSPYARRKASTSWERLPWRSQEAAEPNVRPEIRSEIFGSLRGIPVASLSSYRFNPIPELCHPAGGRLFSGDERDISRKRQAYINRIVGGCPVLEG